MENKISQGLFAHENHIWYQRELILHTINEKHINATEHIANHNREV